MLQNNFKTYHKFFFDKLERAPKKITVLIKSKMPSKKAKEERYFSNTPLQTQHQQMTDHDKQLEKVREGLRDLIKNATIDITNGVANVKFPGVPEMKMEIEKGEVEHLIATCMQIFDPNDYFILYMLCKDGLVTKPRTILLETLENFMRRQAEKKSIFDEEFDLEGELATVREMTHEEICKWICNKQSNFLETRYHGMCWWKKPDQKAGMWTRKLELSISQTIGISFYGRSLYLEQITHKVRSLFTYDAVRLAVFEHASLEHAIDAMIENPKGNWYVKHSRSYESARAKLNWITVDILQQLLVQIEEASKTCEILCKQLRSVISEGEDKLEEKSIHSREAEIRTAITLRDEGEKVLKAATLISRQLGNLQAIVRERLPEHTYSGEKQRGPGFRNET